MQKITSIQNEKAKWLTKLSRNSAFRRKQALFIVEGDKEIRMALANNFQPHSWFGDSTTEAPQEFASLPCFNLAPAVFDKVAYRNTSQAVAVFHIPQNDLTSIKLRPNPFLIIVESVEKPGNLGAILRVADGSGTDAVVVCGNFSDIYNPNIIRSSVGCVFTKPVVVADSAAVLDFCQSHGLNIFAAALTADAQPYTDTDFTKPSAVVLGAESSGLSSFWLENTQVIKIPMLGQNDSLNVSAAAAVLAYEVVRQRR